MTFIGFYGFSYLLTWIMIHQSADPHLLGNVLSLTMLPAIFLNLVAGRALVNISAKKMMLLTDGLTGGLFLVGYVCLTHFSEWEVVTLTTMAVLNKAIGVFYKLSNKTILPELFGPTEISTVNGLQAQVRQLTIVSSAGLITFILGWITPATLVLLMAGGYFYSAYLDYQLLIAYRTTQSALITTPPVIKFRAFSHNHFYAAGGALIDAGIAIVIPWLTVTQFRSGWQLSVLLTAQALGLMIAPFIGRWTRQWSPLQLTVGTAGCVLVMIPNFSVLLSCMFGLGCLRGQFNLRFFTHLQTDTPPTTFRRTMTWTLTILDGTTVAGNLLTPWLIHHYQQWTLPIIGGGLLFITAGYRLGQHFLKSA